jgi:hydroxyisourate hydrolase
MPTLDQLNAMAPEAFVAALEGVFEHAAWVAETVATQRPFATVALLHEALMATVHAAPPDLCVGFLRGHPALSPKALADPGRDDERVAALAEIGHITRLRLVERVTGPGMPKTGGHLSAHVLDTARGKAAEGVRIELFREGVLIKHAVTNDDGRTDAPLLADGPLRIGRYELRFNVENYYAGWPNVTDPPWYDVIPIRFGVAEPEGHYHIPLLLGAWTYTTYRGS